MARLGNRTIGLDGVAEQRDNYQRMGFVPAYDTVRYSGPVGTLASPGDIQPVAPERVADILAYDRICFPAPRQSFLEEWLQPPRIALAIVNSGTVSGYGVARPCRDGFKIGPLFADDMEIALQLLTGLASVHTGETLHIDVPATNGDFTARLEAVGLSPSFTTTRMYRGGAPENIPARVFGVTTLELG